MRAREGHDLVRVGEESCEPVEGGHTLCTTAYCALVHGDELHGCEAVAVETVKIVEYANREPGGYRRTGLVLHRRLASLFRDARVVAQREAD